MLKSRIVLSNGTEISSGKTSGNAIRSVTHTAAVNNGTELAMGAACCDMLEVELWCPDGAQPIQQGDKVTYYKVADNGAYTKIGVFNCEKPTKPSANVYKVTAYDNMSLFEQDASAWLRANQGNFPMAISTLVYRACAQCGVTLSNYPPRNSSYQVQAFYADNITWRQIIQWAAEAGGCYAHCNAAGNLAFKWYTDLSGSYRIAPAPGQEHIVKVLAQHDGAALLDRNGKYLQVGSADVLGYGYYQGGLTFDDYTTAAIDKLQIRQSDNDVGVIYPADETGTNTYVVAGNLLLTTDTDAGLRPVAQALYDFYRPIRYTPCKVTIPATLTIPAGSIITVEDATGAAHTVYVMTATTKGQRLTLECTGSPSRDSSSAVNKQSYSNITGKMLEISTTVDGLDIKTSELSGNYTQLQQTVAGLSVTVAGKIDGAEAQTKIDASLKGLTLSAANGDEKSTLTLKSGSVSLASADITLTGMVTFNALKTSGSTVINGDNITTGALDASLISTGTIKSKKGFTTYNLDTGEITSGESNSERVHIDPTHIIWYTTLPDGGSGPTGIITSTYGKSWLGSNSTHTYLGYMNSAAVTGTPTSFSGWDVDMGNNRVYLQGSIDLDLLKRALYIGTIDQIHVGNKQIKANANGTLYLG